MPERLLFIDTETGGIDPYVHSLLSIGLVVWENGQILAQKEIFVNDGVLNVTQSALLVNQINMDTLYAKIFSAKPGWYQFFK